MKVAVMQPYLFPYLGYYQLIHAVDLFVIYDDVNYIKGGWVNRNRILVNGMANYINVPLNKASAYKKINEVTLQITGNWKEKFIKKIEFSYKKAPFFDDVFPIINELILYDEVNLSQYLSHQLVCLSRFMGLDTEFIISSNVYLNQNLTGAERVIDICKKESASIYVNPQGGQLLYDAQDFIQEGVELQFLFMNALPYKQRSKGFLPNLSIIDPLMEVGPRKIIDYINAYNLSS